MSADVHNQYDFFKKIKVDENGALKISNGVYIFQKVNSFSSLIDGIDIADLSYCISSEGTAWLPSTLGGTYYPSGWYVWDGATWVSDRNAISEQLQLNKDALSNKAPLVHTHIKSDITDFSDSDYATASQGAKADSALQPNDGVSELLNDSLYISGVDGLANYYNVFTYTSGSLTKIETYSDSTLSSKLFTKNLTYSSGVLTKLEFTNETTALTETKDFTYDGSGNLINIEKS